MSAVANFVGKLTRRDRKIAPQTRVGPIGIDFALEEVHLVQLERPEGGATRVRARATVPYDVPRDELLASPACLKALIKRAFSEAQFKGRDAVIAMPSGFFRTVSVNYRSASGEAQESAAIARAMSDRLDGDLNNYVLDYLPVRSRSKSDDRLALVAVSERSAVIKFLEALRTARINITALEIGPVAITRLVSAIIAEGSSENVLVINSGRNASYLTLISGNELLFDQDVAVGEESLVSQVAESLEIDMQTAGDLVKRTGVHRERRERLDSDMGEITGTYKAMAEIMKPQFMRLVEEVRRAFLYAAAETRGGTVDQIYLLGSIARWPGSDQLLSKLLNVTVTKIPDPLALFPDTTAQSTTNVTRAAPEIAVATGLSLRGMSADA